MSIPKRVRKEERRIAFKFLYSLEFKSNVEIDELRELFFDFVSQETEDDSYTEEDFSWSLVKGVWLKQKEIDLAIEKYLQHWKMQRIGKTELTILRIASYELLYTPDIANKIVISEALALLQYFGDVQSTTFINGVLDSIDKSK